MSRSNPTTNISPVKRRFQWKGKEGSFKYYNKDKGENINVPLPFNFLVLDLRSGVTGWSDSKESAIWSNHVKDITKEDLVVKVKTGSLLTGKWNDIKDQIKGIGGKFASFVYVAYKDGDTYQIGVVELKGSSLATWFPFCKEVDVNTVAVSVPEFIEEKNGAIVYRTPVFKAIQISDAANETAIDLDRKLQEYLGSSTESTSSVKDLEVDGFEMVAAKEDVEDDLPF